MSLPLFTLRDSYRVSRRSFIAATSSLAVAALWSGQASGAVRRAPKFSAYPFSLGIASGDPSPDGFVLWTRLAPKPIEGGGMEPEPVEVAWQVAEDESMTKVVKKGRAIANPDWGHSVHVEVGGLKADRWYWYQFKAGSETSPKGRTRTMPAENSTPSALRFAFASCNHYAAGYFTAFDHLSREGVDIVFHLGDYIYEGGIGQDNTPRKHNSPKIFTLEAYRNRYGLYKSDPDFQRAHAAAPWVVTPDDHEVENNYADEISEVRYVTRPEFLELRARAYQAYYEHMPLRRSSLPKGPDMQLFRSLRFGRLANFCVLDTRQYRTDQPCGDGNKTPCADALSPDATLLGRRQREWLFNNLNRSRGAWNVLAQQVMMAKVDLREGPESSSSMDQWPGYEMERRRVLNFFEERKVSNPVVLTGDIHSNWANELVANFDRPESKIVGTEFVGTSISSGGDGTREPARNKWMLGENPHVKFHNAERGYVTCNVTPTAWRSDYRVVDYVTRRGSPIQTRASFTVEAGRPGLQRS